MELKSVKDNNTVYVVVEVGRRIFHHNLEINNQISPRNLEVMAVFTSLEDAHLYVDQYSYNNMTSERSVMIYTSVLNPTEVGSYPNIYPSHHLKHEFPPPQHMQLSQFLLSSSHDSSPSYTHPNLDEQENLI